MSRKVKAVSYAKTFEDYLNGKLKLQTYQKVGILLLLVVVSGFIGWVWEFGLAEIEGDFKHLYIKGGNLLPWINLYAYGAMAIIVTTYWLRKYPWAVFVVSALVTGTLEWLAGFLVFTVGHGTRYWDYTNVWWGKGSIDGFVCPASATVFGLAALVLTYWLLPQLIHLARRMRKSDFLALSITLFAIVMLDDVSNLILKNLDLPTAQKFYEKLGWRLLT